MKRVHRFFSLLIVAVLLLSMVPAAWAEPGLQGKQTTVLFTHDLHSHFLPQPAEGGGESGGYARLKTALDQERAKYPDALVLDGGDFSIGSLIQTLYTTQAAELRTMGALGYDAAAVGNHEFDHTGDGFAMMLNAADFSGDRVPELLMANYRPAKDNPRPLGIQRAMAAYGVKDYMLLERGGVTYGIFGLMGEDSHDCAPTSGFELGDPVENAQRCVDALKEQGAEFIICLSHSGTDENVKKSEDERLAKKVEGIDLIVSGHTHTALSELIVVEDTYIVSSGEYSENLGSITLSWNEAGEKELVDYRLVPIDESLAEDPEIAALNESWKAQVSSGYLARYGLAYDKVLTTSGFDLNTPESGVQQGNNLGELVSDAYLWALENLAGEEPGQETVAVVADGVLRANLAAGPITTSQAFDVLSMGVGEKGTTGFPLVDCYLTGRELKAAAEVDASVTPIMHAAQLYFSGMTYEFNTNRMFFNRVTDVWMTGEETQVDDDNRTHTEIWKNDLRDDQLYRVVTGMYSAQMLGTVKEQSMGLLSLVPKDENGNEITDFSTRVLRDENGSEIKEWYALAAYLKSFGEEGIPDHYAQTDGRKNVSHSWNPIQLLKHPNWITLAALLAVVAVIGGVTLLVRRIMRGGRQSRYGGGRRKGLFGR